MAPAGRAVRPTSDRAREAIFASLGSVTGLRVLDLFAGSGAMGLEAVSRGAASCHFVEHDAQALVCVRANVASLAAQTRATIEQGDALQVLKRLTAAGERYDLVLVDPPYLSLGAYAPVLASLLPMVVAVDGSVVLETAADAVLVIPGLVERYNRRIAAARIVILQQMGPV